MKTLKIFDDERLMLSLPIEHEELYQKILKFLKKQKKKFKDYVTDREFKHLEENF